jgi:ferritin-like metal-binding protein YciE
MFEHFDTKEELFEFQLGSALTMEHDSLTMLRELETAAQSDEVKQLFAHHQDETQQQIDNLKRAFQLMGKQPDKSPSQTTKGLMKEGMSLIAKTDRGLVDTVAISAALGTEHYEISAYESLCTAAESLGKSEVQALLQQNMQQEEHTCDELKQTARKLAAMPA